MAEGVVIDTSVLVEFERGLRQSQNYVNPLIDQGVAVLHPVVAAELLEGVKDRPDQRRTVSLLSTLKRVRAKSADFEACLTLVTDYRLSHGVGWADCLIAAPASDSTSPSPRSTTSTSAPSEACASCDRTEPSARASIMVHDVRPRMWRRARVLAAALLVGVAVNVSVALVCARGTNNVRSSLNETPQSIGPWPGPVPEGCCGAPTPELAPEG